MHGKDKTGDSREERDLTKDNKDEEKDEEKDETMDTNENGCNWPVVVILRCVTLSYSTWFHQNKMINLLEQGKMSHTDLKYIK